MAQGLFERVLTAWRQRQQAKFLLSQGVAMGIKPPAATPPPGSPIEPMPVPIVEPIGVLMAKEAAAPEPVRLVVWDLDETFWDGTLTEGGMRYRRDIHDIVITLAQRGIVSSVCSKNDMAQVQEILQQEGIWDYFVFPSINWEPKGPRLAALVEAVQLRAPTILFIDDNPMNLGEAQHYVPGIQVADEKIIPGLLNNPLFRGKVDTGLSRLNQYKLLERRRGDEAQAGGDNAAFLRESGIVVTIEHDLELHLDRAIELINRTNQLNYTKVRLSENIDEARAELRALLSDYAVQAGILKVRDRYGDYGYCGLYILSSGMHAGDAAVKLRHFCFSCRILNMGVETWLYRQLGRPRLRQKGEVLTDVMGDTRDIDWITVEVPGAAVQQSAHSPHVLDYVYARGACDLRAVTHYFHMVADEVHGEFNTVEEGAALPLHHSVFASHALKGLPPGARGIFGKLGYKPEHFRSIITELNPQARAVWLLSFWGDPSYALYRHNGSGRTIPVAVPKFQRNLMNLIDMDPADSGIDETVLEVLKQRFSFTGMIKEAEFKANVRLILSHASQQTRVFILLSNTDMMQKSNATIENPRKASVNRWLTELAAELPVMNLLQINDFVGPGEATDNPNHFDRKVYFRIYQEIMRQIQADPLETAAE